MECCSFSVFCFFLSFRTQMHLFPPGPRHASAGVRGHVLISESLSAGLKFCFGLPPVAQPCVCVCVCSNVPEVGVRSHVALFSHQCECVPCLAVLIILTESDRSPRDLHLWNKNLRTILYLLFSFFLKKPNSKLPCFHHLP